MPKRVKSEAEKQKDREYIKVYSQNHPEYREACRRRAKEWAKNNRERLAATKKRRRQWLKENNPEEYRRRLAKASENVKRWQAKNKEKAAAYQKQRLGERIALFKRIKTERGCKHCGMKVWQCLDFHHRDPDEKEFNLSQAKGKPIPELEAEIAKCDVVCSNCHRLHHTSKEWT